MREAVGDIPRGAPQVAAADLAGVEAVAKLVEEGRTNIRGSVQWPIVYSVQAAPGAVVVQSTISLIDQNTGITVATGLTDNLGNFNLGTAGFVPAVNAHYILDAHKGLNAQLPGNHAVRMRSILRWDGTGWLSITNGSTSGAIINIHQLTTAIAIQVGLGRIPAASAINTVDTASPPGLKVGSIAGVSGLEILTLANDVKNYIVADRDPVAETSAIVPTISTFNPNNGLPGTVVGITGSGFVVVPGATTIKFNGVAANILTITSKAIYVAVPDTSTTGLINVQTTRGSANSASAFTVKTLTKLTVTGFGGIATAGKPLTVFGTGFVPGSNTVTFAKLPSGNVDASSFSDNGNDTTFTVDIPKDAGSGFMVVKNANGASAKVYVTMSVSGPEIQEVFPNKGVAWGDIQLFGDRFGNARGTVAVDGFTSFVHVWTNKYIRFRIPYQVTAGRKQIAVTSSLGASGTFDNFTALNGEVAYTSWQRVGTMPQGGVNLIPYFSGKNMYFAGGAGSSNIGRMTLNTDGGPGSIVSDVGIDLPFGSGGQDMTGDFQNWIGNTMWHYGNNGTNNKAILRFSTSTGELEGVSTPPGHWNTWPDGNGTYQNEMGSTAGPRGLYNGGNYGGGAACRTYYALWDGVDPGSLTGWSGFIQNPSNPGCSADAILLVLNDRLWWLSIYSQAYSPLQSDGRPTGYTVTGPAVTNYYFGSFTPAGQYIWSFGKWCHGSEVSRTRIVNGNTPQQNGSNWDRLSNANVGFGGAGNQMVIGSWMYFVGGACGNDNVIHAAPITQ